MLFRDNLKYKLSSNLCNAYLFVYYWDMVLVGKSNIWTTLWFMFGGHHGASPTIRKLDINVSGPDKILPYSVIASLLFQIMGPIDAIQGQLELYQTCLRQLNRTGWVWVWTPSFCGWSIKDQHKSIRVVSIFTIAIPLCYLPFYLLFPITLTCLQLITVNFLSTFASVNWTQCWIWF